MKYKVLLIGRNKMLMGDFFMYLEEDFEMQTSSMRHNDIVSHIHYFKPDVLVYCMNKEEKERLAVVTSVKQAIEENKVTVVLTGDMSECENFKHASGMGELIVSKPTTARSIKEKVVSMLDERREKAAAAEAAAEAFMAATVPEPSVEELAASMGQQPSVEALVASAMSASSVEAMVASAVAASAGKEAVPAEPPKKHILVVDDDPMLLKLIKEQLKDSYSVATAISGAVALKFLENKKTDLIILDYEMPNENGAAVLQKIRMNPATAKLPVVFLTGVKDREKIKKLVELKPQGYLLKPIEREKLIKNIKSIIG